LVMLSYNWELQIKLESGNIQRTSKKDQIKPGICQ